MVWPLCSKVRPSPSFRTWTGSHSRAHYDRIHGTSWLALDNAEHQDPYLVLSLFRTHSALLSAQPSPSPFFTPSGLRIISPSSAHSLPQDVPAPLRLIFPHVPTFSTPHIPPRPDEDQKKHPPPRERSHFGVHPLLSQAVLPTVGLWFEEDWEDLREMHVPFVFDRVVIADRGAAERGRANWRPAVSPPESDSDVEGEGDTPPREKRAVGDAAGAPMWASPFVGLNAPQGWWTPMRAALLRYLRLPDTDASVADSAGGSFWGLGLGSSGKAKGKPVVTYVSMQDAPRGAGPRLAQEDHERLIAGLRKLRGEGVLGAVHVVRGNGSVLEREWVQRMGAFAQATVRRCVSLRFIVVAVVVADERVGFVWFVGFCAADRHGPVRGATRGQRVHAVAAWGGARTEAAPKAEG